MIISASRRTDIPAFYSTWFLNRIKEGYVLVRNPINPRQVSRVDLSPEKVDCLVFWSKNPQPLINSLNLLDRYMYYFLFTLNAYDQTMEPNLPSKEHLTATFANLSGLLGKERVIWRYDPVLISEKFTENYHYHRFEALCRKLHNHTAKCIISFYDPYVKTERKLKNSGLKPLTETEMLRIASRLCGIASSYGLKTSLCCEEQTAQKLSLGQGKCIDDELISALLGRKLHLKKDPNQRKTCGCVHSIDIGEYNTCKHHCLYCYANSTQERTLKNCAGHDSNSPLLVGKITERDRVYDRVIKN